MALISNFDASTRRLFVYGLIIRAVSIVLLTPALHQQWFVPFVSETLAAPSVDPWTTYLAGGGDPLAFPYGPIMYLAFVPLTGLGAAFDTAIGSDGAFAALGFRMTVFVADICLLFLLSKLAKNDRKLVPLYWLSPISIFVIYWHGQLDIVPVALFVAALYLIGEARPTGSGVAIAASIAAKLSTLLVVPFILIFLYRNRRFAGQRRRFVISMLLGSAALLPFLLSSGFRSMILGSPLYNRIFDVSLPVSVDRSIFIFPIVYLILVDFAWRLGRMTKTLLFAFLATALLSIVLLSSAPPGWYLWSVPFLALCGTVASWRTRLMIWVFSVVFVLVELPLNAGASIAGSMISISWLPDFIRIGPEFYNSIGKTILIACGLSIAIGIMRQALRAAKFFQLSHRRLAIGIAGDSGTGKSTLAEALTDLFGADATAVVAGDDYHHYDRKSPLWHHLTHIDPRANDLNAMSDDMFALLEGKSVQARHYDHITGRFTPRRKIRPNDIVLVDSLHALVPHLLRDRLDLKIMIEMDELMRRHLKVTRDSVVRGHASEAVVQTMERRKPDYEKYLKPQAAYADIIFRLIPAADDWVDRATRQTKPNIRLKATLRRAIHSERLARALIVYAGLRVDLQPSQDYGFNTLIIDTGDLQAEDTAYIAKRLAPEMGELFSLQPIWRAGASGIMQLIVLMELAQIRATGGRLHMEGRS